MFIKKSGFDRHPPNSIGERGCMWEPFVLQGFPTAPEIRSYFRHWCLK